jgi:hypothetical protein
MAWCGGGDRRRISRSGVERKAANFMKVYAFDVDETLYISQGPVQWEALVALRAEGHVLGLCGNWAAVTLQVPEWHRVLSFIGFTRQCCSGVLLVAGI